MTTFTEQVKNVVRKIPEGSVMTYGQIAKKIGKPRSARAVANVMAANFDAQVPCHRVIRSDGTVGGYNRGGPDVKRRLLEREGVIL